MKFLVDAQLPPGLCRILASYGHEASHVYDLDLADATDEVIRDLAIEQDLIIVSKDEDFYEHQRLFSKTLSVVWVRVGNCTNKALYNWFAPLIPEIVERLRKGEMLIELA